MKELGYGHDYRYAHDEPNAYVAGEQYLPDGVNAPNWYHPGSTGVRKQDWRKACLAKEVG